MLLLNSNCKTTRKISKVAGIFRTIKLLIILFLISSCDNFDNCNKMRMSSDIKSWCSIEFTEGEQYIMASKMGNRDTIKVIENSITFSTCNKFELGPNQYEKYSYTLLSSNFNNQVNSASGVLYSMGTNEYGTKKMVFRAFGMCYVSDSIDDGKIIKENIKVSGFRDSIETYYFNRSNYKLDGISHIQEFNWSKRYGLIRYKTEKKSETFEFYKKIPATPAPPQKK